MRKIVELIMTAVMCLTLTSCMTATAVEAEPTSDVTIDIIIRHGRPFFNEYGYVTYYLYQGSYYYPMHSYERGIYQFHRYHAPLRYSEYIRHYKPYHGSMHGFRHNMPHRRQVINGRFGHGIPSGHFRTPSHGGRNIGGGHVGRRR